MHAQAGDLSRATDDFTAALRLDPGNAAARQNLEQARRLSLPDPAARGYAQP